MGAHSLCQVNVIQHWFMWCWSCVFQKLRHSRWRPNCCWWTEWMPIKRKGRWKWKVKSQTIYLMRPRFNLSSDSSVREDKRRWWASCRGLELHATDAIFQYLALNNYDASDFTLGSLSDYIRYYSVLQKTGALAFCVLKKISYIWNVLLWLLWCNNSRQTFKHLIISPALNSGGFCVWHKLHIISRWQVGRRGDAPPLMMSPYTSTQTLNTDKLMWPVPVCTHQISNEVSVSVIRNSTGCGANMLLWLAVHTAGVRTGAYFTALLIWSSSA